MTADRFIAEPIDVTFSGTTSDAINLSGLQVVAVVMPSSVVGSSMTFTASTAIGGTYVSVYDEAGGGAYTATMGTSRWIPLKAIVFAGVPFLKLVSNGSEAAGTTFKLICRPVS